MTDQAVADPQTPVDAAQSLQDAPKTVNDLYHALKPLGVTRPFLKNLIDQGKIPGLRIARGRYLFNLNAVKNQLANMAGYFNLDTPDDAKEDDE